MLGRTAIKFVTAADRRELRYGFALLAVGVAVAARFGAVFVFGVPVYFPTFFVAVMVAAMVGGLGPGLLALVISALTAWRFWMAPDGAWILHSREAAQLSMFLLCGGLIVLLVEALRRAVRSGLAAEARFRSVQEVSLDAFVILEPVREAGRVVDFRWTYANPMAETMRPRGPRPCWAGGSWTCFPTRPAATWSIALGACWGPGGPTISTCGG
ncbi:DUF4118 domain-containing protein [Caulobacter sp. FWC2]|uniref:DUF4118 domain-containing protein n=1 Tax=Caulobacter sp. FWC2 TaxID=69664 RepID=UPI000C15B1E3|nr:DUF4118 domain-containing protein [Caulobacter sp. FWC2]PIB94311.1 hypothetical protein CSW62_23715 [Caulobacter sp. FWC2]